MTPGRYREGATMKAFWDYPGENWQRFKNHIAEGWSPVLDESGDLVMRGADILFKRPIEITKDRIEMAQRLQDQHMADPDMDGIRKQVDGDAIDDQVSITRGG